ncbi:hypothetical protein TrCOL_g3451 [Triparma columacea]|uniref:Purine nucleoside phosphorylase n=1 Tax=Triparma columacea TaxID=722753 RepID=A0A9W7G328_9STRA|nr:hypothetical protein TrCOL_g3451 [Triparma columacea]
MGDYKAIASFLKENTKYEPKIGIICGSGLSELSKTMTDTQTFPYSSIPSFPKSTVAGHKGELVFGLLSGVQAVCLRGRFHSYEGYPQDLCALPVRVMRCLGVKMVIITNAAGGLDPNNNVGDIICVDDHFALPNMAGKNCLVGPNDSELGPRFPPMSNAYDPELSKLVVKASENLGFQDFVRKQGTYCFVSGPMYESPSEALFLRSVGGTAVGMSTVPEVVAAHHSGMQVLCLSLITNKVMMKGDKGPHASHEEVLEAVNARTVQIQALVKEVVKISRKYMEGKPELPTIKLPEGGKYSGGLLGHAVKAVGVGALVAAAAVGVAKIRKR